MTAHPTRDGGGLAYGWRHDFNQQVYFGPQRQHVTEQKLAELDPFAAELFEAALRPTPVKEHGDD